MVLTRSMSKLCIDSSPLDTLKGYGKGETNKRKKMNTNTKTKKNPRGKTTPRQVTRYSNSRRSGLRYKFDGKNCQEQSEELNSDYFTRFEVEAICEYFNKRVTQEFLNKLGKKMADDSKNNVKQWDAENKKWQKKVLQEVERSRKPVFFRHNVSVPAPTLSYSKNNKEGNKKVSAVVFNGQMKTVLDENGDIPKRTRGSLAWSMTDRAEMTNLTDPYWQTVQDKFLQWDDIKDSTQPHHAGNSVILSQNTAVSGAHVHQWMFWNLVSRGTKLYLMYPIEKPDGTQGDVYNVKTPKMDDTNDFLKYGTIGRISSEIEGAPRFLVAPSFTSHHVITANRSETGYWGSGGFGSVTQLENAKYKGRAV